MMKQEAITLEAKKKERNLNITQNENIPTTALENNQTNSNYILNNTTTSSQSWTKQKQNLSININKNKNISININKEKNRQNYGEEL